VWAQSVGAEVMSADVGLAQRSCWRAVDEFQVFL
jgi:hypothetical protein